MQDFDSDGFRTNLAEMLPGVSPSDIELNVTAASVRVVATITAQNATAAVGLVAALSDPALNSTSALSAALGVTVLSVQPPTIIEVADAPIEPSAGPAATPARRAARATARRRR